MQMPVQVIVSQPGPLPITVNFKAVSDAPIYLELNGSVWTQSANQMIGIQVAIDGGPIGKALIFSNAASTHRTVVPIFIPLQLQFGQHSVTLSALPNSTTVSDQNDYYTVVLHY
jgi:hypothetical protein